MRGCSLGLLLVTVSCPLPQPPCLKPKHCGNCSPAPPLPASLSQARPGQSSKAEVLRVGLECPTDTRLLWPRCELQARAEDPFRSSLIRVSQGGLNQQSQDCIAD